MKVKLLPLIPKTEKEHLQAREHLLLSRILMNLERQQGMKCRRRNSLATGIKMVATLCSMAKKVHHSINNLSKLGFTTCLVNFFSSSRTNKDLILFSSDQDQLTFSRKTKLPS